MGKTCSIREEYDTVQYRFWLIPDFSKDRSVIIFKAHHSMGDGLSISTMFMQMNDTYDSSALSGFKPQTLLFRIFTYLSFPLLLLKFLAKYGPVP